MRRRPNVLALVAFVSVAACLRAAQAQSREIPWLVVPAVTATDESQLDAATAAARALEDALQNAGEPVVSNAEAAQQFEALYPAASELAADEQRSVLKALAKGRAELALGHLSEGDIALQPLERLNENQKEFLRRSHAQALFEVCVARAHILERSGQAGAASDAMQRCVATYPGLKPPAQPEIQRIFEKAQSAISVAPLMVKGPAGCVVRVSGVLVGRSPLRLPQIAIGRTPVQLECDEDVPARRHLVDVRPGSNSLEIDPRFDRVVMSRSVLQLIYDQRAALRSHARTDADAIGEALTARVIVIERDDANSPSFRVTAPKGIAGVLGELHYDARTGVNRDDLLRIVEGLQSRANELNATSARETDGSTPESKNRARAAPTVVNAKDSGSVVQPVAGAALGVLGVGGLVTGWALYAERQDYRLEARPEISEEVMRGFDRRGAWMLAIGGTAAAGLVTAEYLLLPRAERVPIAAWVAAAAGVAGAAVGLAYAVGSDNCEPMAVVAGERTSRACYARTSDAMFGPMLMLSSLPLINVPFVYLLRGWLHTPDQVLALTPNGLSMRGRF